jgi:SAM-dependent methyltransferase
VSTAITINQPDARTALSGQDAAPRRYWDQRAQLFAGRGAGLQAVCSYGMPAFYNWHIDVLQRRALERWFKTAPRTGVLEVGCGVGRWTRRLARAGHDVVGLDLSSVMVQEARGRAKAEGIDTRCRFLVGDIADIPLGRRFDRILGVTVLQHVLDPARFHTSLQSLSDHLADDGLMVLLEAAPLWSTGRCNSDVFVARSEREWVDAFAAAGLRCVAVEAVDPAPFKIWFLPWYKRLPRWLALPLLLVVTAATLPVDLLTARWGRTTSWHKVFVLTHAGDPRQ